jgi:spermidine/putrescine transport system substrate-binding protein
VSTFNDTDEALTKIRSAESDFDIYFPSYDQIAKMVTAKLIRPLNHTYIPNIANVWPTFTNPWYDGEWRYTVPYTVYSTGIGWRNDKVSADIGAMSTPYDVFWDPKYSKNLAVIDDWHTAMAMVALRAGITNINTQKSADLAKIQAAMLDMQAKTKPKVTITMYNDLPAGQLELAQMWSGDIINAQYYLPKGQKPKVLSYWFPPDGKGMVDNDLNVVLRQGKAPVLAHLFLNFMLDSKNALDNFGFIGYQPPQVSLDAAKTISGGYVPANLANAVVKQEWFDVGYRLLELPPAADAAWHQIWQRFKAGA